MRIVQHAAVTVLALASAAQAGVIGSWSFDSGNETGLTSEIGGHALTPRAAGSNATIAYNADGTVSLGGGEQLYSTAISSTAFPALQNNATIYLRLRFDGTPGASGAFAGFVPGTSVPSGYNGGTTLAGFTPNATSAVTYAGLSSGNGIAPGSGFPTIPNNGSAFTTVAIVFDNLADLNGATSATRSRAFIYVDGTLVARDAVGTQLNAFDYLSLGRVTAGASAGPITLDTVQIYDEALSAAQIAAVPEPAALTALALAGGCVLGRPMRRARTA